LIVKPKSKALPPGLARVRKELPPPGKIFRSKRNESRKGAKEKLGRELKMIRPG
jgi:hypothetical protein